MGLTNLSYVDSNQWFWKWPKFIRLYNVGKRTILHVPVQTSSASSKSGKINIFERQKANVIKYESGFSTLSPVYKIGRCNFSTLTQELCEDDSLSLKIQDILLYFYGSDSVKEKITV